MLEYDKHSMAINTHFGDTLIALWSGFAFWFPIYF